MALNAHTGPDGPERLLVVRSNMRSTVLQQLHDVPKAGHLDVTLTYDRVRRGFFWPGLYRSAQKYVDSCELCQQRKRPPTLPAGLLRLIDVSIEPFFRVGLDLLGPFPASASGNKWVSVATDYAARYAITRALQTSCATNIAYFLLNDVIMHQGGTRQLLTDRGPYLSRVIDDLLRLYSIKHSHHRLSTSDKRAH